MREDHNINRKAIVYIVYVALFFSGISALVYEIVWLRLLRLIFGDTVLAVSTLLAAFMAGLAVGSYFIGRFIDRRPENGLRYYGFMEIGIGLYALLVPTLLDSLVPVTIWVTEHYRSSFYTLSLVRFGTSFAILLPATALMGGTLPVLVKHFTRQSSVLGGNTGRFYAINTIGAAVGCLSASFLLIGTVGVHSTITLAAIVNILSGLVVFAASRYAGSVVAGGTERENRANLHIQPPFATPRLSQAAIPWIYGFSGFVALALEVVWVRMLAMLTSMHVQSFGVMLAILLCGMAAGSALYTKWLAGRINAVNWLVGSELVIGAWTLLCVPLFRAIPPVPLPPHGPIPGYDDSSPPIALTMIAPSIALVLVPAILMGMIFPLIMDLHGNKIGKIGKILGRIYGFNTLGGILGSFTAGFVLLPFLGIQRSMILLGGMSIGIAGSFLFLAQGFRLRPAFGPTATFAATVAVLFCAFNSMSDNAPPVQGLGGPWQLIHYREGRSASIRVFENTETGVRELFSDSWYIASTEHLAMRTQKMLANLPLLLHRNPEQVLIVGFGTGTTSGTSMLYDISVDAIELEPSEQDSANLFRHVNYDILDSRWRSKFNLHFDDGRNWLLTRNKTYDVISRDAHLSKPSQDLFSKEFLELAKARLKPGGIFCGFMPLESTYTVKQMLSAFHTVFPHGSVWYVSPGALLVLGTNERLNIDYQLLNARISEPKIRQDLSTVNFEGPNDLLSSFMMADEGLARFVSGHDAASDETPLGFLNTPDFGSPRDIEMLTDDIIDHRTSIDPYVHNIDPSDLIDTNVRRKLKVQSDAMGNVIRGEHKLLIFRDAEGARKEFEQALGAHGDWKEVRFQYSLTLVEEAEKLLERGSADDSIALLQKAIEYVGDYVPSYVLLGRAYEQLGQLTRGKQFFSKAKDLLEAKGYPPIVFVQQKLAPNGAKQAQ